VYAGFNDLHTYESYLDGNPFSPDVYRTDMTPIRVYKYTDGQNDYPFNGPGFFSVPTPPNFEPAGSAWFDFNRNYYTISPFERHSMQGFVAVQAHL
jgi:hypothetical protein